MFRARASYFVSDLTSDHVPVELRPYGPRCSTQKRLAVLFAQGQLLTLDLKGPLSGCFATNQGMTPCGRIEPTWRLDGSPETCHS